MSMLAWRPKQASDSNGSPEESSQNACYYLKEFREMNRFKKVAGKLLNDQEGAALVEYGLLVGLIAAVCVAVITTIGTSVNTKFTKVNDAIK